MRNRFPRRYENDRERIERNVIPVTEAGCWLWTKATDHRGYGRTWIAENGPNGWTLAHRLSWNVFRGPIAEGLCVCHKCDTPACCNPDHLFLGTRSENAIDCADKNRTKGWIGRGARHTNAKVSEETALAIYRADGTNKEIAGKFGTNPNIVREIRTGLTWSSITGARRGKTD